MLRGLTLALLADLPDDLARATLGRWVAADPGDVEARVARLARIAAEPRSGDPDRAERIATLTALLAADPLAVSARGPGRRPGRRGRARPRPGAPRRLARRPPGRPILAAPGRWELDYDRQPARAVASFGRALAELPHDWKTHYRLARALQISGRPAEARRAAAAVARIREALDPATLGPRLRADLARLDDPGSLLDLARLCELAGLARLADAWRQEAASPPASAGRIARGARLIRPSPRQGTRRGGQRRRSSLVPDENPSDRARARDAAFPGVVDQSGILPRRRTMWAISAEATALPRPSRRNRGAVWTPTASKWPAPSKVQARATNPPSPRTPNPAPCAISSGYDPHPRKAHAGADPTNPATSSRVNGTSGTAGLVGSRARAGSKATRDRVSTRAGSTGPTRAATTSCQLAGASKVPALPCPASQPAAGSGFPAPKASIWSSPSRTSTTLSGVDGSSPQRPGRPYSRAW